MGAVGLAGAVADPKEVSGGVVPTFGIFDGVAVAAFVLVVVMEIWNWGRCTGGGVAEVAGEALFILEEKAFMAGVEINSFEAAGRAVSSDGAHEPEGFGDAVDDAGVLGFDGFIFDVTEFPVQWRM